MALLGSQDVVVKCTAAIFFRAVGCEQGNLCTNLIVMLLQMAADRADTIATMIEEAGG